MSAASYAAGPEAHANYCRSLETFAQNVRFAILRRKFHTHVDANFPGKSLVDDPFTRLRPATDLVEPRRQPNRANLS